MLDTDAPSTRSMASQCDFTLTTLTLRPLTARQNLHHRAPLLPTWTLFGPALKPFRKYWQSDMSKSPPL
eukprot:11659525-Alexandrium_andersonii.AAC.1